MTEQQPELLPSEKQTLTPEEQARRESARRRLAEMLKDPQFRAIEGFPVGADEDILALSDPPYYTACPNPFLREIIAEWQQERESLRKKLKLSDDRYQREPFAADVSEGKTDPIYNAHSYHTKVPHKAIMRYILHYTDPGDIVFDGFCGTGMTGVAAQLCGDKKAVEELGYRVDAKGIVWDGEKAISWLGARKAVLNDLSPAATFIAYNYNTPVDTADFEREAKRILREVEQECGWMYETWHPHCDDPKRVKARINYTIWSDVFLCPNCSREISLWDIAVDEETQQVQKDFLCSFCHAHLSKDSLSHAQEAYFDPILRTVSSKAKQVPVRINYSIGSIKYEKILDSYDMQVIKKVEETPQRFWFPTKRIDSDIDLWYERDYKSLGIYSINAFYTPRSLFMTSFLWNRIKEEKNPRLRRFLMFWLESVIMGFSKLNRYLKNAFSQVNRILSGTLYVGSFTSEVSPWYSLEGKRSRLSGLRIRSSYSGASISTCATQRIALPANSLDYVFIDPPFGSNIIYSDLSIIWESWLNVYTKPEDELVVHRRKKAGHTLSDYQEMMTESFYRMYGLLKPGRWITVEFHNTKNSVWNAIQESLSTAGFVIADVRVLDKQVATFKQVTTTQAVKQDLIISAYKPNGNLEEKFRLVSGTEEGVWEFVRYHLGKLHPTNFSKGKLAVNAERQGFLLFDRMVAFHIRRGVMVPISAPEFYAGLHQRFVPRDGMYFLPEQVAEYDRAVMDSDGVVQLSFFITDEKTAIQWLRLQLDPDSNGQPQTHADLNPKFKLALHQAKHEKAPELIEILEQNFLQDEEGMWHVPNHNRASDLERVRLRGLLREFNEYAGGSGRLRQFRTEAVRAGFADAYKRQEYETIIKVAGRLPEDVLREDPDLLMYYDSAMLRKK